jgi:hypothetical protein
MVVAEAVLSALATAEEVALLVMVAVAEAPSLLLAAKGISLLLAAVEALELLMAFDLIAS